MRSSERSAIGGWRGWHCRCDFLRRRATTEWGVTAIGTHGKCASDVAREGEPIMNFINRLRAIVREESGQDLLEYALLVALIALVAVGAVTLAGGQVQAVFNSIAAAIPA
jgi:pilus assembly protein Flp/PilA